MLPHLLVISVLWVSFWQRLRQDTSTQLLPGAEPKQTTASILSRPAEPHLMLAPCGSCTEE